MPTLPFDEEPEPDPRAEQARAIVRAVVRSVGVTDRRPITTIISLLVLAVAGTSNPEPVVAAVAAIAAVIVAITLDMKR